mmetsp:Transcript_1589/g.2646  ORF Transcript_1589/g.2646 Transcript_1589/m.2646 type:complete len:155 (+) Transcript_1589:251-715(+)
MASSSSSSFLSNTSEQQHQADETYMCPIPSTSVQTSSLCKNCQRSLLSKSLDGSTIVNDEYCSSECYWSSTLDLEMPSHGTQNQARSSTPSYGVPLQNSGATTTSTPIKIQPQHQQAVVFGNEGRHWDRETAQNAMFDFHANMSTTFRARTILV